MIASNAPTARLPIWALTAPPRMLNGSGGMIAWAGAGVAAHADRVTTSRAAASPVAAHGRAAVRAGARLPGVRGGCGLRQGRRIAGLSRPAR